MKSTESLLLTMLISASFLIGCSKKENNPAASIQAPNAPLVVSPANGAINQSVSLTLSWSCSDPDGSLLTYDIYIDRNNPPVTLVSSDQTDTNLARSGLDVSTTYYWKVVAENKKGTSTTGNVWSFTTASSASSALSFISAKFNGSPWISGGTKGYPEPYFRFDSSIQGYIFGGISMTHWGMDEIDFFICSLQQRTYALGNYERSSYTAQCDYMYLPDSYTTSANRIEGGTLTITEYDQVNNCLKGTFQFKAVNLNYMSRDTITVTDGSFLINIK